MKIYRNVTLEKMLDEIEQTKTELMKQRIGFCAWGNDCDATPKRRGGTGIYRRYCETHAEAGRERDEMRVRKSINFEIRGKK